MESMDLFWEALYDYYKWNKKWNFYLVNKNWDKFELDLWVYFRDIKNIDELERELLKNVVWENVLDIWCWTAFYFPLLQEKSKNVEWIDISKLAIKVAKEMWNKNVRVENIFDNKINKKYDIITLLWNNLSIWWDVDWTKKFLNILKSLLSKNWKILSFLKKEEDEDYFIGEFYCEYNNKKSNTFKWIRFNIDFLRSLLDSQWLNVKILKENNYGYCLEIKR